MIVRPRAARAAVTGIFALSGVVIGSWAARVPAVQDRLSLSDGELAVALAAIAGGALVAMPLSGALSARAGSRSASIVGIALAAVALPLTALAPSLPFLVAATALLGAGNGAVDVAMNAQGVEVERRLGSRVLSSMHAAFSVGGLLGAASGAAAAGAGIDVRVHFAIVCAAALAAAIPAGLWLLPGAVDRVAEGPRFSLPRGALRALAVLAFFSLLAEGAAADWSAVYIDKDLGASAGVAGLGFAGFMIGMTGCRLVVDRLIAAIGPATTLRAGGTVAAIGVAGALVIGHPVAAIAGFGLLGVGLAATIPATFRAAGSLAGVAPGPALAAVTSLGYLGFLVGPPVIGAIAELVGLPIALAVVAIAPAVTIVLAPTVDPDRGRSRAGRVA